MYCPKCRTEYREGFTLCADCDIDLVGEKPPAPEAIQYVHVYSTPDPIEVSLLKSILQGEGIRYYFSGDLERQSVGMAGGVLFVDTVEAARVREIIEEVHRPSRSPEDDDLADP